MIGRRVWVHHHGNRWNLLILKQKVRDNVNGIDGSVVIIHFLII